jgi:RNase P subunit RPR2
MTIPVRCECGKQLRASEKSAGKRGKCPACGRVLVVPAAASIHEGVPAAQEVQARPQAPDAAAVSAKAGSHAIIEMGTMRAVASKERLAESLGAELRLLFDLTPENVQELLSAGRTTVTTFTGRREEATITWCSCANMLRHQRPGAAGMVM